MPLTALPVTAAELETLQSGIQFFTNSAQATAQAAAINTPGSPTTVFTYTATLLNANLSLSQVAMAVTAIGEGGTIAVGNTTTPNTLTFLSTQFLPAQVTNAVKFGYNPTVYAAEALGLAIASTTGFQTNFGGLSNSAFVSAVASATGVNAGAIQGFLNNWLAFYTANPQLGLTAQQAAYGATLGDSIGVALLNPTSANLQTVISTNPAFPFSPNTVQGLVANALIDVAEGTYKTGVSLGSLPAHQLLQGEAGTAPGTFNLTPGIDTFNSTFDKTTFNALPALSPLGILNNTFNTGDTITTKDGLGTLNQTTIAPGLLGGNPALATGVTSTGVQTLNITGAPGVISGFQGNVTGLKVENSNNSQGGIQLGGQGQGLGTLLTNINILNYAGPTGSVMNSTIFKVSDAAATINVDIKGAVGSTNADEGGANILRISNDTGTGTAANPNLTYGTWSITSANAANLQLEQDFNSLAGSGVGGAKNLILAGAGDIAVGQDAGTDAGHWQLLETIDSSKATGRVAITGQTSGVGSQALASEANDGWLFGAEEGLLDMGGTGAFNLTKVTLGSGLTFLDVSSANPGQLTKLTTAVGAGLTAKVGNLIIVSNAAATTLSTDTFKNVSGFNVLGVDDIAGTINSKNLPTTIDTIFYQTTSAGAVTINNAPTALTVNTFDNGANNDLTVGKVGPAAGLSDSVTLIVGNPNLNPAASSGNVGNVRLFGTEKFTLTSVGANTNDVDQTLISSTSNVPITVTIDGSKNIDIGNNGGKNGGAIYHVNDAGNALILNSMVMNITNTGVTTFQESRDGGSVGDLPIQGDTVLGSKGNPLTSSTNAVLIDASKSGGLIMSAGDANFVVSATVGGSTGATITGSETKGNVLGGLIGNDVFTTTKAGGVADTVYTGGGADTVNLATGNGPDRVEIYSAFGFDGAGALDPGEILTPRNRSITDANDIPQLGWWGQATGGTATGYNATGTTYAGIANGTGTQANATKVSGFAVDAGGDVIDLAASTGVNHSSIWGSGLGNGSGGTALGLVNAGIDPITGNVSGALNAIVEQVNPGDSLNGKGGVNVLALTGQTFANATAVANALQTNGVYDIDLDDDIANDSSAHMIIAWQDFGGNTHISDLALNNQSGLADDDIQDMNVWVSDLVQLTGVSLTSLVPANGLNANIHFV